MAEGGARPAQAGPGRGVYPAAAGGVRRHGGDGDEAEALPHAHAVRGDGTAGVQKGERVGEA